MLDELVTKYIRIRDKKAAIVREHKEKIALIDGVLATAEAAILAQFVATGVESARTPNGTAYKQVRTSATVEDWDATLEFIRSGEHWQLLDRRVNKTGVEQYRTEHNDLPPGVKWVEDLVINVRRS